MWSSSEHGLQTTDIENSNSMLTITQNGPTIYNSTTMRSSIYEHVSRWDAWLTMNWYTTVLVNPVIGTVGILGNAVNCAVLRKSGFRKPSNIFLFCLAVADIFVLTGAVDFVAIMSKFPQRIPVELGYLEFDCKAFQRAKVFMNIERIVFGVNNFGMNASQCLCVVITLERLIAIFLPLKFSRFVRPKTAWCVVASLYLFWFGAVVVFARKFEFAYYYLTEYQTCACTYHIDFEEEERVFDDVTTWLGCYVSLGIIVTGSVLIFVRIRSASRKRRTMTSSSKVTASGSRTTRTLLTVCVLFGSMQIVRVPYAITSLQFPDYESSMFYFMSMSLVSNVNHASNFVIYVILNPNFRRIFKEMILHRAGI